MLNFFYCEIDIWFLDFNVNYVNNRYYMDWEGLSIILIVCCKKKSWVWFFYFGELGVGFDVIILINGLFWFVSFNFIIKSRYKEWFCDLLVFVCI